MFSWKWYLKDLKPADKNIKVLTTFSCGGGSSMGYKRAGFNVIGNVEIDSRINDVYVKNLQSKYNFCMDLRDFNKLENLPSELFGIDILDGSPPCTTFSIAGEREKNWGKTKYFNEGQQEQVLDELFFVWLDTVEKLQPKIAIAENVLGLIMGNAKGYVNLILKRFKKLGYEVQIFKLNSALMDVPQVRERIFFVANNQHYPKLKLNFQSKPITFGEVRTAQGITVTNEKAKRRLLYARATDLDMSYITKRIEGKRTNYMTKILQDDRVAPTFVTNSWYFRFCDKTNISTGDIINISTFPQDYDFCGRSVYYICGMSVPPNMMANIATEIYKQWL